MSISLVVEKNKSWRDAGFLKSLLSSLAPNGCVNRCFSLPLPTRPALGPPRQPQPLAFCWSYDTPRAPRSFVPKLQPRAAAGGCSWLLLVAVGCCWAPIGGCPLTGGAIGQFGSNHEAAEFSAASAVIGPSCDYVNIRRPSRGSGLPLSRFAT
ncbi:hypothetical protein GX48_02308 [Paracoccidioides brasiliensis]|nr:hypothetical protein GX48_02308 [Paracoccidioides brasiliensis]